MRNKINNVELQAIWDELIARLNSLDQDDQVGLENIQYDAKNYVSHFISDGRDMDQLVKMLAPDTIVEWFDELLKHGASLTINTLVDQCDACFVEHRWKWFVEKGANTDRMVWKCFNDEDHICNESDLEHLLKHYNGISPRTAYNVAKELVLNRPCNRDYETALQVFTTLVNHGLDRSVVGNWINCQRGSVLYEGIINSIACGEWDSIIIHPRKYTIRWCRINAWDPFFTGDLRNLPPYVSVNQFLQFAKVEDLIDGYGFALELVDNFPTQSLKVLTEKAMKEFDYPEDPRLAELYVVLLEDRFKKFDLPIDPEKVAAAIDSTKMDEEDKEWFRSILKECHIRDELLAKFAA
jgi:hypothetical protein